MARPKKYDRDAALEKAMKTFRVKGYKATSVHDLVQGTGLNRFSLYDSFGSKRGLFIAVLDKYCDSVMERGMRALETDEEGLGCLRTYLQDYADRVRGNMRKRYAPKGCLMTMVSLEPINRDREIAKRLEANLRRMVRAFRQVLKRARKLGEVNPKADLDDYARFLAGCTQGLDILAKSLSREEMRAYIKVVLASLR